MKEQIEVSKARFLKHSKRHPHISWDEFEAKLNDSMWRVIIQMEESGGEPDLVELGDRLIVVDCCKETPSGRRNLCYDKEARLKRKNYAPENSALEMAESMGVTLVDESMYFELQEIEDFDLKTSSWLLTPDSLRKHKGALFGDRRYHRTFVYHNGADSYYASRGFRAYIELK